MSTPASSAIVRNTPKEPRGLWVMPGTYQVRLTAGTRVDGTRHRLALRLDLAVLGIDIGLDELTVLVLRLDPRRGDRELGGVARIDGRRISRLRDADRRL